MDLPHHTPQEFESWLQNLGGEPSEERMAEILSSAMRTDNKKEKAQLYVDLANMAMALADTTLGVKGSVETSIHLRIH